MYTNYISPQHLKDVRNVGERIRRVLQLSPRIQIRIKTQTCESNSFFGVEKKIKEYELTLFLASGKRNLSATNLQVTVKNYF